MAYLSRRGFTAVDGMDNLKQALSVDNVKYTDDVNSNIKYSNNVSTGVKYDTNVKPDVKYTDDVKTLTPDAKSTTDLELLFDKLTALFETKIAQAVDTLRKEMNVKDAKEDNAKNANVKLCSPCNVNGFTPTLTVSQTTMQGTSEPVLYEQEETETDYEDEPEEEEDQEDSEPENNELEAAQQRIKELEQKLHETKQQLVQNLTEEAKKELAGLEEPVEDKTVEPGTMKDEEKDKAPDKFEVDSIPKFHLYIERMLEDSQDGYLFNNPLRHWPEKDVKNILWVNVRLRCLFVNLVRITNFSHVDKESFTMLTNGFISLYNSRAFQSLPADYPYTNLFTELTDWLRDFALKHGNRNTIKVILTVKRKARIVAICHELEENTEIVKFSELKFEPLRTEKEPEPRNNEADEEKWRKRRKEIELWKQHKKAA